MTEKLVQYQAAGGVVLDANGRVLLIERTVDGQHEIRLPKGHIDPGEKPEEAALREVCEETGYCDLTVLADLGWQTVNFLLDQKRVEREERYYVMHLASDRQQPPRFSNKREALFCNRWAADLESAEALLTFEAEKSVTRKARATETVVSLTS